MHDQVPNFHYRVIDVYVCIINLCASFAYVATHQAFLHLSCKTTAVKWAHANKMPAYRMKPSKDGV